MFTALFTAAFAVSPTVDATAGETYFSTKQPYYPPAASYSTAPDGFHQVYTATVNRHGSRGLSSWKYDDLADQMLRAAEKDELLTDLGHRLIPQVEAMHEANLALDGPAGTQGYGNLTRAGREELRGIGKRHAQRNANFLRSLHPRDDDIIVTSSGQDRATESGEFFLDGLLSEHPDLKRNVAAIKPQPELLYAHKSGDERYEAWKDGDVLAAKVDAAYSLPAAREAAESLLSHIFAPEFIAQLDDGTRTFHGRENESKTVEGIVDAAVQFYNLYIIAPAMSDEDATPPEGWIFTEYMDPADGPTFAYLLDVEDFYEKGPAIAGETVSYDNYEPLLLDILRGIRDRASGGKVAAEYRFGHAETIIPLAALMELPGSEEGVPAEELMTYQNSPWRGEKVSPMAANLQWDAFQNDSGETIVRVLYNEEESPLKAGCVPIAEQSHFYTLDELEACLPLGSVSDHAKARPAAYGGEADAADARTGVNPDAETGADASARVKGPRGSIDSPAHLPLSGASALSSALEGAQL